MFVPSPYKKRAAWQSGMPMKRVPTCTGNEKKYISPGNDWFHWLVNSSEETYIKLPFPHNVPFTKKTKWKSWKSLWDHLSSSYYLAKKPVTVIEFVLLLSNCCTFIKKHFYIIRGLVLLAASPKPGVWGDHEAPQQPPGKVTWAGKARGSSLLLCLLTDQFLSLFATENM